MFGKVIVFGLFKMIKKKGKKKDSEDHVPGFGLRVESSTAVRAITRTINTHFLGF